MIHDRHLTDLLSIQEVPPYKLREKPSNRIPKNALGKITVLLEHP
jgi:hypothetical protein